MSRVGKKPIEIPQSVDIKIEGNLVKAKGPKGELQREVRPEVKIEIKDNKILVTPISETKKTNAIWGLTKILILNIVKGVTQGYEKKLQIEGVGYRANLEGEDLVLTVGFSHSVRIEKPEGIQFSIDKNIITVSGIDKELVGQIAAKIRAIRPPEPYKGKGIRYFGEVVKKKASKKVVATTGTK